LGMDVFHIMPVKPHQRSCFFFTEIQDTPFQPR